MKAAWYEKQGAARDVLVVGRMPDPQPGAGEVRIRISASAINPGDLKKREDSFSIGMPDPRVIPHSDGAGLIDQVGEGVPASRIGERVWCYGAQSYRPFGTAAEYAVVPAQQAVALPENIGFEQGACLGIPGITAHRAVHAGGPVQGRVVLVQGGGGAVGSLAVGLARRAGAFVIATVRSRASHEAAMRAGAHHVVRTDGRSAAEVITDVRALAPAGVHHIVEVAFDTNVDMDLQLLAMGGAIAAYATANPRPSLPFWDLLFKNARILLLGSDDFPEDAKLEAALAVNDLLRSGWHGLLIDRTYPLAEIAAAHEHAQTRLASGRVVVTL
jgi:NADPH:quinone reductase